MRLPMLVLLFLAYFSNLDARAASVIDGPVTNSVNGHWYYLLDADYWTNAEAQAIELGGHLVTINDDFENTWVLDMFGSFAGVPRPLFIGFTDQGYEGSWGWTSGEPVTYTHWNYGEPNNGGGYFPYENYSMMYAPDAPNPGSWNDIIGSDPAQQFFGVVEVQPLVTVPVSIRFSQVEICWPSVSNTAYQVQYKLSLSASDWTNLGNPIVASGDKACATDAVSTGQPQKFYRVLVL